MAAPRPARGDGIDPGDVISTVIARAIVRQLTPLVNPLRSSDADAKSSRRDCGAHLYRLGRGDHMVFGEFPLQPSLGVARPMACARGRFDRLRSGAHCAVHNLVADRRRRHVSSAMGNAPRRNGKGRRAASCTGASCCARHTIAVDRLRHLTRITSDCCASRFARAYNKSKRNYHRHGRSTRN